MAVGAVFSVWSGTSGTPLPEETRTPVRSLPVPALGLILCPEVGNPIPVLGPSLGSDHLKQGANPTSTTLDPTPTLGKHALNRHPLLINQASYMAQATARVPTMAIATDGTLPGGLRTTPEVTDEAVVIRRGRDKGIGTARGETPIAGITQNPIKPGIEVITPLITLGFNPLLPSCYLFSPPTFLRLFCW